MVAALLQLRCSYVAAAATSAAAIAALAGTSHDATTMTFAHCTATTTLMSTSKCVVPNCQHGQLQGLSESAGSTQISARTMALHSFPFKLMRTAKLAFTHSCKACMLLISAELRPWNGDLVT